MLHNSNEYRFMYEVEGKMWWYKLLHDKVIYSVIKFSAGKKDIKILDAGCGTGGLMLRLKNEGFTNVVGFDFNDDAVAFSKSRGHNVQKLDITNLEGKLPLSSFDIVISNDVIYQFNDIVIEKTIGDLLNLLRPGGIFITNNNAFKAFRGIHDIAVGSQKRFILADFNKYLSNFPNAKIITANYWSLLLSPLILIVRQFQKLKLKFNLVNLEKVKSDVEMPSPIFNSIFYSIVKFESKVIPNSPFGSSLFMVISKENRP